MIGEYIAPDSPDDAALFVTRLIQAADRLAEFPQSGRTIPEIANPACRETIVAAHRIM